MVMPAAEEDDDDDEEGGEEGVMTLMDRVMCGG